MFKKIWESILFRQVSYFLLTALAILFLGATGQKIFNFGQLLEAYELKSYDIRAKVAAENEVSNPDIVILSIDDDSIDILQDKLGRWPWSRDAYTQTIKYLEREKADSIVFDLMFVGYQKGFEDKDIELAETIAKYDNVYVSMNFDDRPANAQIPEIPQKLTANVENQSKIDFLNSPYTSYTYPRMILDKVLESTDQIGFINFRRDAIDYTSRRSPTFFGFSGNYYPYLAIKAASDYIKRHENLDFDKYIITPNNELIIGNRKLPLDENGSLIISWYNSPKDENKKYIPFWRVYQSALNVQKGEPPLIPEGFFRDKIVYVGVTAASMYDIKSTPISSVYPGVEIQTTVVNNILDNRVIKRVDRWTDLSFALILGFLVALTVIKIREPVISSLICVSIALIYIFLATYLLDYHYLWIGIIGQIMFMIATFTVMFIIKYVLKAKDFEYTYKLATTDGLTGLYNHRFFQEKLKENMAKASRTRSQFSMILIDIDYFKKFNDTYGHQAGDEVLRQTAQTLKKAVKPTDLVARYGGEEMVILLDGADLENASVIARRVCKTMADKQFELAQGLVVNVTISLGVATYPIHGKTSTDLIEFADRGLYNAKKNGRNQLGALPEVAESV